MYQKFIFTINCHCILKKFTYNFNLFIINFPNLIRIFLTKIKSYYLWIIHFLVLAQMTTINFLVV